MPNNPKLYIHETLVEICFRIEDGLPLVCTPYMSAILTSYLARAQTLYPVEIVHYLAMGNHVHMMFVVDDPNDAPRFVNYFKRETAHAINRLLGRRKRTVWTRGYDSPIILDAAKAIDRSVYIYTNPQRVDLVDKIDEYPNLSSWNALMSGGEIIETKRIPRDVIERLPGNNMSFAAQQELADRLKSYGDEECQLVITPNAWLKCFPQTKNANPDDIRNDIVTRVRLEEERLRLARKYPVLGAHALRLQRMDMPHTPEKFGRRMICLASLPETRIAYIAWFRSCCAEVNSRIHKYPGGMFAPGGFLFTNAVPFMVPVVGG